MSNDKDTMASGFDDLERDLLRSAELLDVPSEAGKQRTRALMALGAVGTVAALTQGASSAGSAASGKGALGALSLGKGLLLGTVGLATVGAIFFAASHGSHRSTRPSPSPVVMVEPAVAASAASVELLAPDEPLPPQPPIPVVEVSKPSAPPPTAALPMRGAPAAAPDSSAGLADQIAALDHARDLLGRGRAGDSLAALGEFDRRFPNGSLAQEAAVTRIEALFSQGRAAEATALVNRFVLAHPSSSHVEHLRKLARDASPPSR